MVGGLFPAKEETPIKGLVFKWLLGDKGQTSAILSVDEVVEQPV